MGEAVLRGEGREVAWGNGVRHVNSTAPNRAMELPPQECVPKARSLIQLHYKLR